MMAAVVAACQRWARVPVALVHRRPAGAGGRRHDPARRLVEFLRHGHRVRLLRHVPGDGQHAAGAASSLTRLLTFVLPALWLSRRAGFELLDVWHLSVASVFVQAVVSVLLVRGRCARGSPSMPQAASVDALPA